MFTLTTRRAPRFCGRIWAPTASRATLPPSISGWQIPLYTGVVVLRHASTDTASASLVRFVDKPQKVSGDRRRSQPSGSSLLDIVTPKPKTEAWYDFFLSDVLFGRASNSKRKKPQYRYQPGKLNNMKLSLPEALRDRPLAIFDRDHGTQAADIGLVHQCLELYIKKAKASPENIPARQRYVEDAPGAKALLWSMSLSESDRHEVWSSSAFMVPVVHCLVTEKNTEALWQWLELENHLGPENSVLYTASPSAKWKQNLLRNMVEA